MIVVPDFSIENEIGKNLIAGVDEAGRGPLCGPVVAAAVIFPSRDVEIPVIIRDSKKMSAAQRATAYDWITQNTIWATGACSPAEIDELNILWASMRAMERAVANLSCAPDMCLIDGNRVPMSVQGRAVVRGDAKSLSIAAASIIAKETRDKIMRDLSVRFPEYAWDRNAGYPTAEHLCAIEKYGVTEHHRRSFGPVKNSLNSNNKD